MIESLHFSWCIFLWLFWKPTATCILVGNRIFFPHCFKNLLFMFNVPLFHSDMSACGFTSIPPAQDSPCFLRFMSRIILENAQSSTFQHAPREPSLREHWALPSSLSPYPPVPSCHISVLHSGSFPRPAVLFLNPFSSCVYSGT